MYRKAAIRDYRPGDEPLLFGLARLDRGADERTLAVLEGETVFVAEVEGGAAGYVACVREGRTIRAEAPASFRPGASEIAGSEIILERGETAEIGGSGNGVA